MEVVQPVAQLICRAAYANTLIYLKFRVGKSDQFRESKYYRVIVVLRMPPISEMDIFQFGQGTEIPDPLGLQSRTENLGTTWEQ